MTSMKEILTEQRFQTVSDADKQFIIAFDEAMTDFGYDYGGNIGSGFCWGNYMAIWAKTGVKSKQVAARVYIRDDHIVLRLFLTGLDKHRAYLESLPPYLKAVFTGSHGRCKHCEHQKQPCRFRKTYTIDGEILEKCSGITFEFYQPNMEKLLDYVALLREFFGKKRGR